MKNLKSQIDQIFIDAKNIVNNNIDLVSEYSEILAHIDTIETVIDDNYTIVRYRNTPSKRTIDTNPSNVLSFVLDSYKQLIIDINELK